MPFGDHTETYRLALPPGELPKRGEEIPSELLKNVPVADPPWWWSDYLMDEWKRTHGLGKARDGRTNWQRDRDQWEQQETFERGAQFLWGTRAIPRHAIWDAAP